MADASYLPQTSRHQPVALSPMCPALAAGIWGPFLSVITVFNRVKNGFASSLAEVRNYLRRLEVRMLLRALKRDGFAELAQVCGEMATERATELSAKGLMDLMDREGFQHCFACIERFSLRLVERKRVCERHLPLLTKGTSRNG